MVGFKCAETEPVKEPGAIAARWRAHQPAPGATAVAQRLGDVAAGRRPGGRPLRPERIFPVHVRQGPRDAQNR